MPNLGRFKKNKMDIEFTIHAKDRIKKRKIKKEEVIEAINKPDKTEKYDGKYYIQKDIERGKIEIVYWKDKYIKIITLYWI